MNNYNKLPEFNIEFNILDILEMNNDIKILIKESNQEITNKLSELIKYVSEKGGDPGGDTVNNIEGNLIELAKIYFDIKTTAKLIENNPAMSKSYASSIGYQLMDLSDVLSKNQVEVIDHTGKGYVDKYNYHISQVIDSDVDKPMIVDTLEPEIRINGKIVKQAEIIVEANKEKLSQTK